VIGGQRRAMSVSYSLSAGGAIGFTLGAYDATQRQSGLRTQSN